jgi:hypothetical protein
VLDSSCSSVPGEEGSATFFGTLGAPQEAAQRLQRRDLLARELAAIHAGDAEARRFFALNAERYAGVARPGEHYLFAVGRRDDGAPFDIEAGFADADALARAMLRESCEQGGPWVNVFSSAGRFTRDGVSKIRSGRRAGQTRRFSRREHDDEGRRLIVGVNAAPLDLDIATGSRGELVESFELRRGELVSSPAPLLESIDERAIEAFAFTGGRFDADLWATSSALQGAVLLADAEDFESDEHFLEVRRTVGGLAVLRVLELRRATGCTSDAWADLAHSFRAPLSLAQKPGRTRAACGYLHRAARRYTLDEVQRAIADELGAEWRRVVEGWRPFGFQRGTKKLSSKATSTRPHATEAEGGKVARIDYKRDAQGAPVRVNGTRVLDLPAIETRPGESPADAFNRTVSLDAALRLAGWSPARDRAWTRPGGTMGEPHANELATSDGVRVLHVFSTKAAPHEAGENLNAFRIVARELYEARTHEQVREAESRFVRLLRNRGVGARSTRGERAAKALERGSNAAPIRRTAIAREQHATSIDEARAWTRDALREWVRADAGPSIAPIGPPGVGKTTLAGEELLEGLADRAGRCASGVAALALPTREIVREKLGALRARVEALGLAGRVVVLPLLGRQEQATELGYFCADFKAQRKRVENGRGACDRCSLLKTCKRSAGRYLADVRAAALARQRGPEEPAVLFVATHAAAGAFLHRAHGPLVIDDDAGGGIEGALGVVREVRLRRVEIEPAADKLELLVEEGDGIEAGIGRLRAWAARHPYELAQLEAFDAELAELLRATARAERADVFARWVNERKIAAPFEVRSSATSTKGPTELRRLARGWARRSVVAADRDVAALVRAVLRGEGLFPDRLRRIASELGDDLRRELLAGELGARWGFEMSSAEELDDDAEPAVARRVLAMLAEVAREPETVAIDASRDVVRLYARNELVVEAMRAGRVAVLGVVSPLAEVVELGQLEVARVQFHAANLRTLALGLGREEVRDAGGAVIQERLGAGRKMRRPGGAEGPDGASIGDATFRRVVAQVVERLEPEGLRLAGGVYAPRIAALGHKKDRPALRAAGLEGLALELAGEGALELGHFGADHASTDRFRGCGVAVLRGHSLPPLEVARGARALRAALRVPPVEQERDREPIARLARWGGELGGPPVATYGPADPLEAALAAHHESAAVVNALGRLRAVARTGEALLAVIVSGAPCEEVAAESLDELEAGRVLGFAPRPGAAELRAACARARVVATAEKAELRRRFEALLAEGRVRSRVAIAAELGVTPRQIARWSREWRVSAEAGRPGVATFEAVPRAEVAEVLRGELSQVASLNPPPIEDSYTGRVQTGHLPNAGEVAAELARDGVPMAGRSIRRALALFRALEQGEAVELPRRASAVSSLRAVARAVEAIRAKDAPAASVEPVVELQPAPSRRPRRAEPRSGPVPALPGFEEVPDAARDKPDAGHARAREVAS